MTETRQIHCDRCLEELTYSKGTTEYYLTLAYGRRSAERGVSAHHLVLVYPPLDGSKHFCGMACLAQWMNNKPSGSVTPQTKGV